MMFKLSGKSKILQSPLVNGWEKRAAIVYRRYQGEAAAAIALIILLLVVASVTPSFFSFVNLRDLVLSNVPVLITAIGMTMIILTRQIDISVGAQFALYSVIVGILAKAGFPIIFVLILVMFAGGLIGAVNGIFVAVLKVPSIVVTLGLMVALRDGLRWVTEGKWVQGLPRNFQWFGLGQTTGQILIVLITLIIFMVFAWGLKNLVAGRAVYAVGSDAEATRLAGISPQVVLFSTFALMGALTGIAALLNSIRFSDIQSNAGIGLELKAIASVVVGGTSINGGRGTLVGTLIGVALLGTIGTALTFMGINPFWEKALQGAIILASVVSDVVLNRARLKYSRM